MQRNIIIDAMRVLGLLLIILAHVQPPSFIFQLRTFDVPMMIFVSGMAYYYSGKSNIKLWQYSLSRFKRLVFPVWIFLVFFFLSIFIFEPVGFVDLLMLKTIVSTFLLGGFGYVWIIKVFLIIAICSPVFVRFIKYKSGYALTFITLAMLLVSLLVLNVSYEFNNKYLLHFLSDIIFPATVYGTVFMIGYKVLGLTTKEKLFIFFSYLIAFAVCVIFYHHMMGKFSGPQYFKYPPSLFYIAYSLIATFIVMWFFERFLPFKKLPFIIGFMSSNTIWIYLWHIPVVEYFRRYDVPFNFVLKYFIAVFFSVVVTLIQVYLIKKTKSNSLNKLFTG